MRQMQWQHHSQQYDVIKSYPSCARKGQSSSMPITAITPQLKKKGTKPESPHYPCNKFKSCTLIVLRLRYNTTRIANPIAASAAATVRMKKTNISPVKSPENL